MKALLDNAAVEASADHLVVGDALSSDQIANLSSDIVWYVSREVDGQKVLVPTLYLAGSSKTALNGDGATLSAGGDASLTADKVANQNAAIAAAGNLTIQAQDSIANESGRIAAGGSVALAAESGGITDATATTMVTGASGVDRTLRIGRGTISAGTDLTMNSGAGITVAGADVTAGGRAALSATGDVTVAANTLVHDEEWSGKGVHAEFHDVSHDASTIHAGGGLSVTAGKDVTVAGSALTAGGDVAVSAGGSLSLASVEDTHQAEVDVKKGGGLLGGSTLHAEEQRSTAQGATVTGGGSVALSSGGAMTLEAARVAAGTALSLSAGTTLSLLSATDSDYARVTRTHASAVWQSSSDVGHSDTTVRMTELSSGSGLSVSAGSGIVADYKASGDFAASLSMLARDPKTAWAAQLATRDDVTWNAVQEAHQSWDYHSQGLTALASAIIAIAVTVATMGAGSQAIGLTLSTNAAGEVTGGTLAGYSLTAGEAIMAGAAADAGFSALVSQATVSLINNQGDLGKTLEDLGSLETVKSIAISMGTAAAFAEVGTLTDGHFGGRYGVNDAGEPLNAAKQTASDWMGTEQYFENVLGHALVGCASGAASGGSCASGAASAAVSDAVTPVYSGSGLIAGTALSAGTGAATAALTGDSAAQGAITGAYGYLYNAAALAIPAAQWTLGGVLSGLGVVVLDTLAAPLTALPVALYPTTPGMDDCGEGRCGQILTSQGQPQTPDQQALGGIVKDATRGGRIPLSNGDADTVIDWGKEYGVPVRDDRGTTHWVGGDHIHVPGSGVGHVPVDESKP